MRIWTIVALALCMGGRAHAYFLDHDRNFDLRARIYSEAAIAAEDSQSQTIPPRETGQLIEHRNFFNPEFEGKLASYLPFHLEDFSFRLALWGFYDGIYDYGTQQYNHSRQFLRARFTMGHTYSAAVTRNDETVDTRKLYTYQPDPVLGSTRPAGEVAQVPFRVNENYFQLTQGPVFVRVGRQTISWGESDTIALLDQQNPFNVTLGAPGIFQDVDEARIPLYTLRSIINLVHDWGPFSSTYLDMYLVPGSIDTTVSDVPIPTASPYSPPETDPQAFVDAFTAFIPADVRQVLINGALGGIQFVEYNLLPSRSMSNSRYGFRLGSVINRDFTTSLWYYRTLAQNPVPVFQPLDLSRAKLPALSGGKAGQGPAQLITETFHGLTDVFGGATSFFSQPLNGVVRGELEFFYKEPAFIPSENIPFQALVRQPRLKKFLTASGATISSGPINGFIPRANMLRWELGFDRFFFYRPINPSNSFTFVGAWVGQWNTSETLDNKDYRYYGQRKLAPGGGLRTGANVNALKGIADVGKLHTVPSDFVDLKPVEQFVQGTLQTDYFHGRLTPRLTAILNFRGTYGVIPTLEYRYSDNILFDFKYVMLAGGFFTTGFFRDRDQLSARITYLLN